ncbi:MAG: hypothetical protein D6812_15745, partial [Deltaproteobacteria bacterium]
ITGPRWQFWLSIALLGGFFLNKSKYAETAGRIRFLNKWLVPFLFFSVLTIPLAVASEEVAREATLKLVKILIFTYVMVRTCRTWREFEIVWGVILLGSFYFGWDAFIYSRTVGGRVEGVGGPDCSNANHLGVFLLLVLPMAGLWVVRGKLWMRAIAIPSALFSLNALILTQSRGAFLGAAFAMLIGTLFAPPKLRMRILVAAVIGVVAFFHLTNEEFWQRMETLDNVEEDASANTRLIIWSAAYRAMKDHPLGLGGENFPLVSQSYEPRLQMKRATHNTWLQAGTSIGWPGLFAFFGLLASANLTFLRLTRRKDLPELSLAAIALLCGFSGALLAATFTSRFYGDALYWFIGMAAILKGLAHQAIVPPQPAERTPGKARQGGPVRIGNLVLPEKPWWLK